MRITVIIPTLNESDQIAASIESGWNAAADEVIVVDGGSHDDTLEQAIGLASQVLVTSSGRGHQQNFAAASTTADWLIFLHADNRLADTAIEQLRFAAREHNIACGAYRQSIEAAGRLYRLLERGNALRVRRCGMPYGDQAIFVRRDLFQSIGGFPETPIMEDYILMRRLRRQAWPILLEGPVYVSARRWQKNGVLFQTMRNWMIVAAYRLGISPQRLARMYYPDRRTSDGEQLCEKSSAIASSTKERPQ